MEPINRALAEIQSEHHAWDRPCVTLTYAQSLDGSLSALRGQPLALSGPDSARMTHQLRAAHDAILVGIGTVLSDDPGLDVRLVEGRNPRPVVLDSRLRIPLRAKLLNGRSEPPLIVTTERAPKDRVAALEASGAQVLCLPAAEDGRIPIPALLQHLHDQKIDSLMVEGGSQVITSFLCHRLVDFFILTIAPVIVGGLKAVEPLSGDESEKTTSCFPRLNRWDSARMGDDLVLWGQPAWPE